MRPYLSLSMVFLFACAEAASAGSLAMESLPNGSDSSVNAAFTVSGIRVTGQRVSDQGYVTNALTSIEQINPSQLPSFLVDPLLNSILSTATEGTAHFTLSTNVPGNQNWAFLTLTPNAISIPLHPKMLLCFPKYSEELFPRQLLSLPRWPTSLCSMGLLQPMVRSIHHSS